MGGPVPTRSELQDLARLRLREAELLLEAGHSAASMYLCGYAVECALKARICRLLQMESYPEGKLRPVYGVHDLQQLLTLAGMTAELAGSQQDFQERWVRVSQWTPEWRYTARRSETEARWFLRLVQDEVEGVFSWISRSW